MSRRFLSTLGGVVMLSAIAAPASATLVEYDVSNISGDTWRYDYTVTNDSLSSSLDEFTVFFQLGEYQDISFGLAADGWDPLAIQPDPLLPDDGYYDALALIEGLAPGATLGGFSATFTWLGTGTPGSQPFDIVDPITIATLDSGMTRLRGTSEPPTSVPEPGGVVLLAAGLIIVAMRRMRLRTKTNEYGLMTGA
jgi:hypothetical protein